MVHRPHGRGNAQAGRVSRTNGGQTDLFGGPPPPVGAASPTSRHHALAAALPHRLRLGTSSWSFPGWAGIVYDRPASPPVLARHGLAAYALHPLLRTVCVDRSYYRPVESGAWREYAAMVGPGFRVVTKAERVLVQPEDPLFLDPAYATVEVIAPFTEGAGETAGVVLFQFPPLPGHAVGGPRRFAERLYRFLDALPRGPAYAVELRSPDLVTPDYVAALQHGGAVHGYVVHPRALPLAEQLRHIPPGRAPGGGTGPLVLRWMLRPDLGYEEARDLYEPFDRLVDEDPETRALIGEAALEASATGREVYLVANNKAEGSSPLTVFELAEWLVGRLDSAGPPAS